MQARVMDSRACQAAVERLEAQATEAGAHAEANRRTATRRVPLLQRVTEPTREARLRRAGRRSDRRRWGYPCARGAPGSRSGGSRM